MTQPGISSDFSTVLPLVTEAISRRSDELKHAPTLASPSGIAAALGSLPSLLPERGWGTEKTIKFLIDQVAQGLAPGHAGPRYMGFVTGGVTPAAQLADILVGSFDQNVQVHLPSETISTIIEAHALTHVLSLLDLPADVFQGRTLTTGATAANVLGLATARDSFFLKGANGDVPEGWCIAEDGFPPSTFAGRIEVLGVKVHASIVKAAAITGIGRRNCIDLGDGQLGFDLVRLEERLKQNKETGKGSIVVIGAGEVNTGGFTPQVPAIRALCDTYGGWIHIDAAFGAFAALLPSLAHHSADLALADSITADGHKWLNVPYDLGLFFTRSATSLPRSFGPSPSAPPPAYLTPSTSTSSHPTPYQSIPGLTTPIPSPLNIGIENSRRFRALPLYASLLSLGRAGYRDIIRNNIALAHRIRVYLVAHPAFVCMNPEAELNVVLFRGSDQVDATRCAWYPGKEGCGAALAGALNTGRQVYGSPTVWEGYGAVRLAVSNWMAGEERGREEEWEMIRGELDRVGREGGVKV